MATLAETPSHGRLPKSLNTKLVKLFPSGLLVYTTEKPPGFRGWNALVSLIIVAYFTTVSPTPPPHSFVLLLSSVACSIPLGHWRHASETAWVGSMSSCSIIRTLVLCRQVPLFTLMAPVSGLHPLSPRRAIVISASVSRVMLAVFWGMRNNLWLGATDVRNCAVCVLLETFYQWAVSPDWSPHQPSGNSEHSSMVSPVVLVIDPAFFIPF